MALLIVKPRGCPVGFWDAKKPALELVRCILCVYLALFCLVMIFTCPQLSRHRCGKGEVVFLINLGRVNYVQYRNGTPRKQGRK